MHAHFGPAAYIYRNFSDLQVAGRKSRHLNLFQKAIAIATVSAIDDADSHITTLIAPVVHAPY